MIASLCGILDFQDAVYGPITYELDHCSGRLRSLGRSADTDWLIRYWKRRVPTGMPVARDFSEFYRDYEWMGVQRHLKYWVFCAPYHRDGKDGYLKSLPLVMAYLRAACARYIDLSRY